MSTSERLTFFRVQKGITVNKLANMAGISQSAVREIELGKRNPTVETLALLCSALDISLKDFFDDGMAVSFREDPLLRALYKLNEKQRAAILAMIECFLP